MIRCRSINFSLTKRCNKIAQHYCYISGTVAAYCDACWKFHGYEKYLMMKEITEEQFLNYQVFK